MSPSPLLGSNEASCMCARSHIWLSPTTWTVAYQAASAHGLLQARAPDWGFSRPEPQTGGSPGQSPRLGVPQARAPDWVAVSSFRASSPPRERTRIFCAGRRTLTAAARGCLRLRVSAALRAGTEHTAGEGWLGRAGSLGFAHTRSHVSASADTVASQHRARRGRPDDLQGRDGARREAQAGQAVCAYGWLSSEESRN